MCTNRPLVRPWECSQSRGQKNQIFFTRLIDLNSQKSKFLLFCPPDWLHFHEMQGIKPNQTKPNQNKDISRLGPEEFPSHQQSSPHPEKLKNKHGPRIFTFENGVLLSKLWLIFQGHHGIEDDVFLSLPCVLGNQGICSIIKQRLSDTEKEKLQQCARTMLEVQQSLVF